MEKIFSLAIDCDDREQQHDARGTLEREKRSLH